MITVRNNVFHLATTNTSYVFFINEIGLAEHLYYGKRLKRPEADLLALREKRFASRPGETSLSERDWQTNLNDTPLEFSSEGLGDFRTPFVSSQAGRNCTSCLDFRYRSNETFQGVKRMTSTLPQAIGSESDVHGVRLDFQETNTSLTLSLYYTVFPSCDTIVRRAEVRNNGDSDFALKNLASCQLDFFDADYTLTLIGGPWGRENRPRSQALSYGTIVNESRSGFTGQKSNTIILEKKSSCYILGLIYSGDHKETVEVSPYGKTHVVCGINSDTICPHLKSGDVFETPEAFMVYATQRDDAVESLHTFEENHVIRGTWKNRLRPVAYNTRYSLGLDVMEDRVMDEIKAAAELGFELFILDDGWFGVRESRTDSQGDWTANTMKLPGGLAHICKECHKRDMLFGLWLSPEVISQQSRFALEHPDWLVRDPRKKNNPTEGGQFLVDLTQEQVFNEVLTTISTLIERVGIDAIRWDLGCQMSDIWSRCEDADERGTWRHRYIMAFYKLQRSLSLSFPNLLIENVSSTSPRFDLALLSSSSLLSATVLTDPFELLDSLCGASLLVPTSCLSNILTERRFNMEGRYSSFSTAFNIAVFGTLTYSISLKDLSHRERVAIKDQIAFYKLHRATFQFGRFRVIENGNRIILSVANRDNSTIIMLLAYRAMVPNAADDILFVPDAVEDAVYQVSRRVEKEEITSRDDYFAPPPLENEAYVVGGDTLKYAGVRLCEQYLGSAYDEDMRVMGDHSSRLYVITRLQD